MCPMFSFASRLRQWVVCFMCKSIHRPMCHMGHMCQLHWLRLRQWVVLCVLCLRVPCVSYTHVSVTLAFASRLRQWVVCFVLHWLLLVQCGLWGCGVVELCTSIHCPLAVGIYLCIMCASV